MPMLSLSRAVARSAACCTLVLAVIGCGTTEPSATPWEILHGTSTVAASKAVDTTTYAQIVALSGMSGSITVADDSTLTGWFKLFPADSQHHFTGSVSFGSGGTTMSLTGFSPWKYRVITGSSFPDIYGLVSDTTLTADLVGDAGLEHYRQYWELHR